MIFGEKSNGGKKMKFPLEVYGGVEKEIDEVVVLQCEGRELKEGGDLAR